MTARPPPARGSGGFTLLEVIVALAIFALSAVVLGSAYVNVLNGYELARHASERHDELEFARAQLLAQPDQDTAAQGGEYDSADGGHVSWHAQIDTTQTTDLFAVTFTCETTDPRTHAVVPVTEHFMVLRPTWATPTDHTTLLAAAEAKIAKIQGAAAP